MLPRFVWHVAFYVHSVPCHVPAFQHWHVTLACGISHSRVLTLVLWPKQLVQAKAKKQVGHMLDRDWNGRPHASPSALDTSVCLEISISWLHKQELDGASSREVACSFLQKENFQEII